MDFSIKNISEILFTSKATLVRFAQKCGYHGYKDFIYQYEETFIEKPEKITGNTRMVLNAYRRHYICYGRCRIAHQNDAV